MLNIVANGISKVPFMPSFGTQNKSLIPNNPVGNNTTISVQDCGTGVAPKLNNPSSFLNNPTLACLGASALSCKNARGILTDNAFPTIFEIIKLQDSCNFKLSYSTDSTLVDTTGAKMASQSISCPINSVKAIENTNANPFKLIIPDKTDLSKYSAEIYFYGTIVLFLENNFNKNKIQDVGCSGEYIQSVIAGYNKTKGI